MTASTSSENATLGLKREGPATPAQQPSAGNDAIDLLKAFAILAVLWQHTVPASITEELFGNLWVRPAVPVFFIVMGLNAAGSLARRRGGRLTRRAWVSYLARRGDRIVVPFLIVLAAGYVIGVANGSFDASPALLIGGFPIDAPGSYFMTALIPLVAIFPVIFWCYARRPVATLIGCVVLNIAFETVAVVLQHRGSEVLASGSLLYQGNPLRWLGVFALGLWTFTDPRLESPRNRVALGLAVASCAYLVGERLAPGAYDPMPPGFLRDTNVLAAPWAWFLVALGMRLLPETVRGRTGRGLVQLGRASFHVYLIQILWTGVIAHSLWSGFIVDDASALAVAPTSILASIAFGYAYFKLVPSGSAVLSHVMRRRRNGVELAGS